MLASRGFAHGVDEPPLASNAFGRHIDDHVPVVVEVRELHVRDGVHPRALHRHAPGAGLPPHLVVDVL